MEGCGGRAPLTHSQDGRSRQLLGLWTHRWDNMGGG
jgi:hypothetical protein